MGKFHKFLTELPAHNTSIFSFADDNLSKCQLIFTKLTWYVHWWYGDLLWDCSNANGLISSIFDRVQGLYTSGKCQGNLIFFKVRELSGNSVMSKGKMKFCKNVREFYILTWWSWNVWSWCIFFAKFIKFLAPILPGKFEFVSGKCQGIVREFWSVLNLWTLELSARDLSLFSFLDDNLSNVNGFSPNLVCAMIVWRSGLGLLMAKFYQFLTVLTAGYLIVAGYYRFTFLFGIIFLSRRKTSVALTDSGTQSELGLSYIPYLPWLLWLVNHFTGNLSQPITATQGHLFPLMSKLIRSQGA